MLISINVFAKATIPEADIEGATDNPVVGKFAGSFIVSYTQKNFDEVTLPLAALEEVEDEYEPKEKKTIEGKRTRLIYVMPAGASPLEVLRNYQQELTNQGGQTLFECKDSECGGSPTESSRGSHMSLFKYLWPKEKIQEKLFTTGWCAQSSDIVDQRYAVMEIPQNRVYVSILTYLLVSTTHCEAISDRTVAVVDVVEVEKMEKKIVTVNAEEMARTIATKGSVALYGIYFDFGKVEVKTESQETLMQIAKLLNDNPELNLLVAGHTDNVGDYEANLDLSKRRAEAVVTALTTTHMIDNSRLMPVGVSFASPIATNTAEEGRAKNRRVELVEN